MRLFNFLISCFAIGAITSGFSFVLLSKSTSARGLYSLTCKDTTLTVIEDSAGGRRIAYSVLRSLCRKNENLWENTGISVDHYVGVNEAGYLIWQNEGRYSMRCPEQSLKADTVVVARCFTSNGLLQWSELDLNDHIANINGFLHYVP